jgi:hypothetical protein
LAEDLHLSVTWGEYDEDDLNFVTWRFLGTLEELLPDTEEIQKTNGDTEREGGEWEHDDNEESQTAVDRVLKKYRKVQVMDDDEGGRFDAAISKGGDGRVEDQLLSGMLIATSFSFSIDSHCAYGTTCSLRTGGDGKVYSIFPGPLTLFWWWLRTSIWKYGKRE